MVMIRFNISIKFATTKAWGWLGEPRIRNTLGSSCNEAAADTAAKDEE
jgi:hypothetical protein